MLVVLLLVAGVLPACTPSDDETVNPVVQENQHPGTDAWKTGRPGFSVSGPGGEIEGYASATSVNKGEQLTFQVSVNPSQTFTADLYRIGWYGGLGGRLMAQVGSMAATKQRACAPDPATGVVDCAWSPTFTFTVPDTWTSGVYLVLLTNAQRFQSYMTFVVRDDSRSADLLYQQSVTTYQAYNNYPMGSGKSLYEFNSHGVKVSATENLRAAKVSFDRPYADGHGSGQFSGNTYNWERYFIGWLEQSGFDVAYSTNLDTHTNGQRLRSVRGFISTGHDEYWSEPMRTAITAARDGGVGLGFFGSNTGYWKVRFEPSAAGVPDRVMTCYKSAILDPASDAANTVKWRDPAVNQPEQTLVGVQYTSHVENNGKNAIYVVDGSSNWVWAGTEVSDGTRIPGILGYETDRLMPEYPRPESISYTILSQSPIVDVNGQHDYSNSSIYQAPSGAWVFASGSNHWSLGLGGPREDARVQRATANVLQQFLRTRSAKGSGRR